MKVRTKHMIKLSQNINPSIRYTLFLQQTEEGQEEAG